MNVTLNEGIQRDKKENTGIHPQKFALWLGMASITMFFVALTSAVLVKKGDYKVWENFRLPGIFAYSTAAVIAVSVVIHLALISYRRAKFTAFRWLLFFSFLLGCTFLILQWLGWKQLAAMGMTLTENVSGSFIYLITSMHGLHIIGGLLALMLFLIFAIVKRNDPIYELRNIVNPKRQVNMEMLVTYWHFVDVVWVYLYIFFLLNYQ